MIAIALLLISQAASPPHTATSSVVISAAQFQRMKNITIDAIATAAHLRVDLDTCEADKGVALEQRDRSRAERNQLRLDLVGTPAPAVSHAQTWLLPVVVGAAAAAIGAIGCAALHCNI